jgi:hypothetical protein
MATGLGLHQGLKYGGSLIKGVKAGLAVAGAVAAVNGVMNVAQQWDKIQELDRDGRLDAFNPKEA